MKIIYPTTDLVFQVQFYDSDNNIINLSQVSNATIKLFTDNESAAAVFSKADLDASSNLCVDSSVLASLENGILLYKYTVVFNDPAFPDHDYTVSNLYQTNLYLQNTPEHHKPTTATCVSELYNDADYITKEWALKNFHSDGVAYATEQYVDTADASIMMKVNEKADSSTTYTKTQANDLFVTVEDASTLVVEIINDMDLPQGLQGTQGYMGTQGERGTQGYEGPQGVAGTPGEQGTQGYIGTQGEIGAQGYEGPQGQPGSDGNPGQDGEQGTQGYIGTQGEMGTQGYEGPQGVAGTPGEQGTQGYIGTQGEMGTQGYEGPQGQPGPDGNPGLDGNPGMDGNPGPDGEQGTQGFIGTQGERGTQGYEGPQGVAGTPGELGTQGYIGTQGEQGTQGAIGTPGEQGTIGTQGVIGTQGEQGTQGERGAQGEPGPASTNFYTKSEIDAKFATEWYGTQAQYEALSPNYDASTNYYILVS